MQKSTVGSLKKKGISLIDSNGELIFTIGDRNSKNFKNFKVDKEREEMSFSITSKIKGGKKDGYTLTLQAATRQEMLQFVNNLQIIMKDFQVKNKDESIDLIPKSDSKGPSRNNS